MRTFAPSNTYVELAGHGVANTISGGEAFWSLPHAEIEEFGRNWLVSEFEFNADWPNWEMHPNGDEVVYLLSGAIVMLFETNAGFEEISMVAPTAIVVPRGVWHTATVRSSARMLHITRGAGTQHRPANPRESSQQ